MQNPVQGEIGDRDETTNREDIPVNEVESSGEESGLIEVETVQPDDMFAFCMDQIVNASTREERQEARDLLVDNFGEASLHEFDLDVIGDKDKQSVIACVDAEQPSTSNASPVSHNSTNTRLNRKSSQKQLDYFRKYWQKLKKNPAKHQKELKRMQIYYKQRMQRMSEDDKKAYNKRMRDAYHNMSAEKKRERNRKGYQQSKSSTANKFVCKFPRCGKSFVYDKDLIKHERIHLGIKPFACTWPNCQYTSNARGDVTRHIRINHFKLPVTKQKQQLANIIDDRNPNDYVRVNNEQVGRRLE